MNNHGSVTGHINSLEKHVTDLCAMFEKGLTIQYDIVKNKLKEIKDDMPSLFKK